MCNRKKCISVVLIVIITTFFVACGNTHSIFGTISDGDYYNSTDSSSNHLKRVDQSDDEAKLLFEDRLIISPVGEDIPKSILNVFSQKEEFNLIFDMGYDIVVNKSEESDKLSVNYYDPSDLGEIGHITTNIEEYKFGRPYYDEEYRFPIFWYGYKVIDLDFDGINELVYRVSKNADISEEDGYYVIFHDIGGKAYAYATFLFPFTEDGVATNGHGEIVYLYRFESFDSERYYIRCLAYIDMISSGNGPDDIYICNGKRVSSDECMKYWKEEYEEKEPAVFKCKDGTLTLFQH